MLESIQPEDAPAALWIRRWTVVATFALLISTYRLWFSKESAEFPQIPAFAALCDTPHIVDTILLLGLIVSLLGLLLDRPWIVPVSSCCGFASGIGLVLLDQHRLQPWFYQFLLFALIFTLPVAKLQLRWLRLLVISIYAYSAIGKLDFEFFHTVGQQFLNAALGSLGFDLAQWPSGVRLLAVAGFPAAELLLASVLLLGTIQGRTRLLQVTSVVACLFHLTLMLIFGLGLQHSWGVVLWNLQFAVQAILLFWPPAGVQARPQLASDQPTVGEEPTAIRVRLATTLIGCAMTMPLFERLERWDHWPSWALYAPHSSRVELFVARTVTGALPKSLQALMPLEAEDRLWVRVPLAEWSLAETGTPIYPQARFELGVCRELAEQLNSEFTVRVMVLGTAGRFDGRRQSKEWIGSTKIDAAASDFILNTKPRRR